MKGTRILAVASPGGHWEQLLLLAQCWSERDVVFARAKSEGRTPPGVEVLELPDAARGDGLRLIGLLRAAFAVVWRVRPDVVVTTGAAPGLAVLIAGKLLGARTIWVDSLANIERVSLAGRLARPFSDHWLTQWPHLEGARGPQFEGAVL